MKNAFPEHLGNYNINKVITSDGIIQYAFATNEITYADKLLKIFNRELLTNSELQPELDKELKLAQSLISRGLPTVEKVFQDHKYDVIVMEDLPNGNLKDYLKVKKNMLYNDKIKLCIRILNGIICLHEHGMNHGCLNPDNIYFDSFGNPKLIGYGLHVKDQSTELSNLIYRAPEEVKLQRRNNKEADMWSFGLVSHQIVANSFPFIVDDAQQYIKTLITGQQISLISVGGILDKIVERCLDPDPNTRITSDGAREMFETIKEYKTLFSKSLAAIPRLPKPMHQPFPSCTITLQGTISKRYRSSRYESI
ncbi:AGC family protein kinase [Trichomonas vaginalis G3]|uniref:AGC family protein kinase n=1 Tax=Trichomonas vaginalis (strain ATCC PRA-98 / G3) TaxID=412133 RepID=A2ECA9_TRIV3|nr:protein serine/threonine kinase protein [Trichomonas vaginalis G3]EAY09693.1 AGC family protein kinase [Trichomonas vaginalis G3]KAI5533957.1 protein serine/threonine kinase protein [Trichomonas vaginalis G3]|eukprot:XP_001321916.1 AGC family protein kinase [Trichomonas vaginalis G3]